MPAVSLALVKRNALRTAIGVAALLLLAWLILAWLWQQRPSIDDLGIPLAETESPAPDSVVVTWLGVTTLLFDDGETQILIDGFFSRPSLTDMLLGFKVASSAAAVDRGIHDFGMQRIAAIIPAHTHFDHAMDIGAIANRSNASILGSESAAQIARGAGVPEDQIIIAENNGEYTFGNFVVTMIESQHIPFGWRGSIPIAGSIDEPLQQPAAIDAWREGGSYSIIIAHPQGTTLVQASAGFVEGLLTDHQVDNVMLGIAMLDGLGIDYAEKYWQSTVTETGASRIFPIHFDDYSLPFGEIELLPSFIDNFGITSRWLEEFRSRWDSDSEIRLPVFGQPLVLYAEDAPDA